MMLKNFFVGLAVPQPLFVFGKKCSATKPTYRPGKWFLPLLCIFELGGVFMFFVQELAYPPLVKRTFAPCLDSGCNPLNASDIKRLVFRFLKMSIMPPSPPPLTPRQPQGRASSASSLTTLPIIAKCDALRCIERHLEAVIQIEPRLAGDAFGRHSRAQRNVHRYRAFQRCYASRLDLHHIAITARLSRMHHPPTKRPPVAIG